MAKNIVINEIQYNGVPQVNVPQQGGGTAVFTDTSDATLDNGSKMLPDVTAYADGVKYTGSMVTKSAQTFTPTTSDQTIAANQYLTGVQTIKGDANLQSQNIADGVTIFNTVGSLKSATISQDSTTKILYIS